MFLLFYIDLTEAQRFYLLTFNNVQYILLLREIFSGNLTCLAELLNMRITKGAGEEGQYQWLI